MTDEIFINYNSIVLKDKKANSWNNKKDMTLLLDVFFSQPFLELKYYCSKGRKKIPFNGVKDIIDHILNGDDLMVNGEIEGRIDFYTKSKSAQERAWLFFSKKGVRLSMSFKNNSTTSLSNIKNYMLMILEKLDNTAHFGSGIYATFKNAIDFPRIKPPKFYSFLSEQAIINIFDKTYFELYPRKAIVAKLDMKKLISNIEKNKTLNVKKIKDKLIVTWVESLEEEAMKKGLSDREDFINDTIELETKQRYNELGEKILFNISELEKLSKLEYFTYYSNYYSYAFKMLVLDKDKNLHKNDLAEIKKFQKTKKLKDGREIKKIIIVVPAKEYVKNLALNVEVYKVLYLDDELNCWDINPDGNWKN